MNKKEDEMMKQDIKGKKNQKNSKIAEIERKEEEDRQGGKKTIGSRRRALVKKKKKNRYEKEAEQEEAHYGSETPDSTT